MESPFLYGKTVREQTFTNRTADVHRLSNNLISRINTILISPRRWGKSSLVKKVANEIQGRKTKLVMLDLMGVRNEQDFFTLLALETIKATSNKLTEWIQTGKEFLKHITPKISLGSDPVHDFELSFEWKELAKHYKEILNLPQKIAESKKLHFIVCIDEFQNCASFNEPLLFQKRLRTEWQHHYDVTYCLYGSKQHLMATLFEKQSMPFYKFGDVMYLPKIERAEWVKFICRQFASTKKTISEKLADTIASVVEDHSYYVQQLSHMVWVSTTKSVSYELVEKAVETLLDQNSLLYTRDSEELTFAQHNFLKAIAHGVHKGLSSKDVLNDYHLGTSANVQKIKKALIQKELIDVNTNGVFFLDPGFQLWFERTILQRKLKITGAS